MRVKFRSRGRAARGVPYQTSAVFDSETKTLLALTGLEAGTKVPCRDEKQAKSLIRERMIKNMAQDGDVIVGTLTHARIEKEK